MEKAAPEQLSIVMQSLLYWEQEKNRALELDELRRKDLRCEPTFDFSVYLPRWEKRLRKRLGQVQIVLDGITGADPSAQP